MKSSSCWLVFSFAVLLWFCAPGQSLAESFRYGDRGAVGLHDEEFSGQVCRISVHGKKGGSYVCGNYDQPNGELKLTVDRLSHLTIRGRARKVTIVLVDLNCSLDLSELAIGSGGVEIHSVDRRSKVVLGKCLGNVQVRSVDGGSTVNVRQSTNVQGANRFFGDSRLLRD